MNLMSVVDIYDKMTHNYNNQPYQENEKMNGLKSYYDDVQKNKYEHPISNPSLERIEENVHKQSFSNHHQLHPQHRQIGMDSVVSNAHDDISNIQIIKGMDEREGLPSVVSDEGVDKELMNERLKLPLVENKKKSTFSDDDLINLRSKESLDLGPSNPQFNEIKSSEPEHLSSKRSPFPRLSHQHRDYEELGEIVGQRETDRCTQKDGERSQSLQHSVSVEEINNLNKNAHAPSATSPLIYNKDGGLKDEQQILPLLKLMIQSKSEDSKTNIIKSLYITNISVLKKILSNAKFIQLIEIWLLESIKRSSLVTPMLLKLLDVLPFTLESLSHCKVGRIVKKMSLSLSEENEVNLCNILLLKWKKLIDATATVNSPPVEQQAKAISPDTTSQKISKVDKIGLNQSGILVNDVNGGGTKTSQLLSSPTLTEMSISSAIKPSNSIGVNKSANIPNKPMSDIDTKRPRLLKTSSLPNSPSSVPAKSATPTDSGLNLFDDLFKPSLPGLSSSKKSTPRSTSIEGGSALSPALSPLETKSSPPSFGHPIVSAVEESPTDLDITSPSSTLLESLSSGLSIPLKSPHIYVEITIPRYMKVSNTSNENVEETPAEPFHSVQKQSDNHPPKKRVRFAPDEFLIDIRYIDLDFEERNSRRGNYKDADKSEAVAAFKKGMDPSISWLFPKKLSFADSYTRLFSNESEEKFRQENRERFVMSIHFMDESQTPDSAAEADHIDPHDPFYRPIIIPMNPPSAQSGVTKTSDFKESRGNSRNIHSNTPFTLGSEERSLKRSSSLFPYNSAIKGSSAGSSINGESRRFGPMNETDSLFSLDSDLLSSLASNPIYIQDIMQSVSGDNPSGVQNDISAYSSHQFSLDNKRLSSDSRYHREDEERRKRKDSKTKNICMYYKPENPSMCKNGSNCPFLHINKT